MVTSLLLDLDDTLLDNSMDDFLPAYLRLLAGRAAGAVDPQVLPGRLMTATEAMVRNTDPTRTLLQTFEQVFYPAIQSTPELLRPVIDRFYAEDFPRLQNLTRPRPAAKRLMDWAHANGIEVVIATNPLFPRVAVEERLRWAGTSSEDHRFALVASLETFHFSKPHPEFLAEILARINRGPADVLVVGDRLEDDILPAETLGSASYWINPAKASPPEAVKRLAGSGTLEDLFDWLRSGGLTRLEERPTPPPALPHLIAGNLAAALATFTGVEGQVWSRRTSESEWSLGEIACHLRDVEREVHFPRIRAVAEEDNPFIPAVDSDVWAEQRQYCAQEPEAALRSFVAARMQTLEYLRGLTADAWSRPCRHAIFGPTSLAEITSLVVDHDRVHLAQLRETKKKVAA